MNRRDLLKTAGGALAVSMIPRELVAAGANVSPLMTTLSEYMASAGARPLPDAVVEKTKHMILDTLAAAISGSDLPPGQFAINFARAYGGEKISTVDRRQTSSADRSRRRSPTACSPIRTRPTTRIRPRSRIPAAPSSRRRWRSARSETSTDRGSCGRSRSATTSARASPRRSASCSTWPTRTAARTRWPARSDPRPRRPAPPA